MKMNYPLFGRRTDVSGLRIVLSRNTLDCRARTCNSEIYNVSEIKDENAPDPPWMKEES